MKLIMVDFHFTAATIVHAGSKSRGWRVEQSRLQQETPSKNTQEVRERIRFEGPSMRFIHKVFKYIFMQKCACVYNCILSFMSNNVCLRILLYFLWILIILRLHGLIQFELI